MSYLPHSVTRRISEICILSSSQRIHIISSEKVKLYQDRFSPSVYDAVIPKALILAAVLSVFPIQIP